MSTAAGMAWIVGPFHPTLPTYPTLVSSLTTVDSQVMNSTPRTGTASTSSHPKVTCHNRGFIVLAITLVDIHHNTSN